MSKNTNKATVAISQLRAAKYNPRKWSKQATEKLTESIERFGFIDPVIVNGAPERKNIVIGGHFRLYVAKQLGMTEVPVVYVNIPEEERERELNLRLNRNTGEWDLELLKEFDVSLLLEAGFDEIDLGGIWDDALTVDDDHFNVDQHLQSTAPATTQPGDTFRLGRHMLVCGQPDTVDVNVFKRDPLATVVLLDPPAKVKLAALEDSIEHCIPAISSNAHMFAYCQTQGIGELQAIYQTAGITLRDTCLWVRPQHQGKSKRAFIDAYQPCLYGTIGKPPTNAVASSNLFNQEIGSGSKAQEDISDLFNIWLANQDSRDTHQKHSHKPPTLHEKMLRRCSRPGDAVLNMFAGIGSMMVACEQMQRTCYMVEPEPKLCDLILARYEALTGDKVAKL